jgi:hypothetical protein
VHRAFKMFRGFELSFDERLIDNDLRGDIREFAPLDRLLSACAAAQSSSVCRRRPPKCNRSGRTTLTVSRRPE